MKLKYERIGGAYRSGKEKGMAIRIIDEGASDPKSVDIGILFYKPTWEQAENIAKMFTAAPDFVEALKVAQVRIFMLEGISAAYDAITETLQKAGVA